MLKTKALADDLDALDVTSLGAAGTFIVRKPLAEAKLRAEFAKRIPFEAEIMIAKGSQVVALVEDAPFASAPEGTRPSVTMLAKPNAAGPTLPLDRPGTGKWALRLLEKRGPFVLALRRPGASGSGLYPNEVVERAWGVPATTRDWTTIQKVAALLEARL